MKINLKISWEWDNLLDVSQSIHKSIGRREVYSFAARVYHCGEKRGRFCVFIFLFQMQTAI